MKFKTNLKRFLSMSRQTGGFTLVELIVVIAILAILAGVAIPAYSGYITKANEAADQQLLAAVNRAFAATCIENGFGVEAVTNAGYDVATHAVTSVKAGSATVDVTDFNADYQKYFVGNETSEFKTFEYIGWNSKKHMFEYAESATFEYTLADGTKVQLNIKAEDVEKLKNSTFAQGMTMEELTQELDDVIGIAGFLGGDGGSAFANVLDSEDFKTTAMDVLGATTEEEYRAKNTEMIAQLMDQGMSRDEAEKILSTRAAVLYTAKQTSNMSAGEAKNLFTNASVDTILNKMNSDDGAVSSEGLAQAAIVCGMYTAYVNNSANNVDESKKDVNVVNVAGALEDEAFMNYINSEQGQKDLEGYLGSLSMVNSAAGNGTTAEDLLVNGFAGGNLADSLDNLID